MGDDKNMASKKQLEWSQPEKLILLEGWAKDGLSQAQIAKNMGIGLSTFKEWINQNQTISASLKKGKEVADYEVENALYKTAIGFWTEETTIEKMLDDLSGKMIVVREKTVKKFVPGNAVAQKFWLTNRTLDKWKDKREETINTEDNNITVKLEGVLSDYAE